MSDSVNSARATVALLWRGDPAVAQAPAAHNNRLYPLFESFATLGGEAVPVVYSDRIVGQVSDEKLARTARNRTPPRADCRLPLTLEVLYPPLWGQLFLGQIGMINQG